MKLRGIFKFSSSPLVMVNRLLKNRWLWYYGFSLETWNKLKSTNGYFCRFFLEEDEWGDVSKCSCYTASTKAVPNIFILRDFKMNVYFIILYLSCSIRGIAPVMKISICDWIGSRQEAEDNQGHVNVQHNSLRYEKRYSSMCTCLLAVIRLFIQL